MANEIIALRYHNRIRAGPQMGITDYLSRDPSFSAPKPQDESELVITLIIELNTQKNAGYLKTAAEIIQKDALRPRNSKRKEKERSETQTERRRKQLNSAKGTPHSETVELIGTAFIEPISDENVKRRLKNIRKAVVK